MQVRFEFVVQTTADYLGGHAHEACAFITGIHMDNGPVPKLPLPLSYCLDLFRKEHPSGSSWHERMIELLALRDISCFRFPTPYEHRGSEFVIFLREEPTDKDFEFLRTRTLRFFAEVGVIQDFSAKDEVGVRLLSVRKITETEEIIRSATP